jgi:tetratricopeptide (TPR) repeat protein/predicted Ser/Thr protein kinase
MMTPQMYQRARDLFARVRQIEQSQRDAVLDANCAGDPELRACVAALLDGIDGREDDPFLDVPPLAIDLAPQLTAGKLVGDYRLIRLIGEGGMGLVYEAEQQHPRRRVALKLIRPLFAGQAQLRRFEHEAQVLARLDHPGIARIFEAGTIDRGGGGAPQPFFAMELIRGQPLNEYVAQAMHDTRRRLELLVKICHAVQHAHEKGVVHRDLKPSNILVDESGQPRILDFGVARAIDADVQAVTMQTQTGQLVGTLPYMSPEQAGGDVNEIDTRSDVYALGVIAFELLAARLPYAVSGKPLAEAARIIRDQEPTRLSSIDRSLRGDVETIVGKALHKEKPQRYGSAGELAADITRFLNYEPISARPASSWYQLSRFARRNKALVAGLAAVMIALAVGMAATAWQAHTARQQRREAQSARDVSDAVRQFMSEMLGAVDSKDAPRAEITIAQQADRAARTVGAAFHDRPLVQSEVRYLIGDMYLELGRLKDAEAQLQLALANRRQAVPRIEDDLFTTEIMSRLSVAIYKQGRADEGIDLCRQVLARTRRLCGENHIKTIVALRAMGAVLLMQRRLAEAQPYVNQALERARATLPEDDAERLSTIENTAGAALMAGRPDEAERLWREVLGTYQRIRNEPEYDDDVLRVKGGLAMALGAQGQFSKAEPLLRDVLERYARKFGTDHPTTIDVEFKLAGVLIDLGRHAEAQPLLRHVSRQYTSMEHPEASRALTSLAVVESALGRADEAERLLREVLDRARRQSEPRTAAVADACLQLAGFLLSKSDWNAALPVTKELFDLCDQGAIPPEAAAVYSPHYGLCLAKLKNYTDARAALLKAYDWISRSGMAGQASCAQVMQALAEVCDATARPDESATWRAKLAPSTQATR